MLFASWLYKDDELRDGKKLFPFVFSFSKMMLSFSKRMVSFRKVHWVFFLSLELCSSFEKKNSMDFPSGHQPFASGETNLQKKIFFFLSSPSSQWSLGKTKPHLNSPTTQIFSSFICFHIPNLPSFKIPNLIARTWFSIFEAVITHCP